MEPVAMKDVAHALRAHVVGDLKWTVDCVATDTRSMPKGNPLFVALKGDRTDGHYFVEQAAKLGAATVVVETELPGIMIPQLIVGDTRKALGDLGRYYRDQFDIAVVGVTGSVGKTSTKEMTALALGSSIRVAATIANNNNEIGVPLTLLGLDRATDAVVVEMGMRGPGQIRRLAEIARPTVGVITNIGLSHIEFLHSRDNIAEAKGELLRCIEPAGFAIINGDDEYAPKLASMCDCPVYTFGLREGVNFRVTDLNFTPQGDTLFKINSVPVLLHATGKHHAENAAAACAVASVMGIPLRDSAQGLRSFQTVSKRGECFRMANGAIVYDDTYNSAPDSVRSSLQSVSVLAGVSDRRIVAVLGDMKELGAHSAEAHRFVGGLVSANNVGLLVTVGDDARIINEAATALAPEAKYHFANAVDAAVVLKELIEPNDAVLVKGSREMKMEKIVSALDPGYAVPDVRFRDSA